MNKQPEVTALTRKRYMDAFWKLYRDLPVEKIRIDMVSREAGYNRTTFYLYFEDIYDLRRQAEDGLVNEYREKMFSLLPGGVNGIPKEDIVRTLMTLFDAFGDRIIILTGERGDSAFQKRLEEQAMPLMRGMLGTDAGEYTNYIFSFVYNAITGAMLYWYRSGRKLDEEKLFSLLYSLISEGAVKTALSLSNP